MLLSEVLQFESARTINENAAAAQETIAVFDRLGFDALNITLARR